jgi:glycosyltransferase involved in cell wall biosynthesis
VNILHLNNEKTWRGGERQTLLLAAGLRDRGVRSVIGCRPDGLLAAQARAAAVETLAIPGNNFSAALALIRAAKGFDLIHCHTGRGHSLAAITASAHGKPFLATRRVDFLPRQNSFNRYKFRRAERVACISRFIADQLANWEVPRDKLPIIPSAVPMPDLEVLSAQHRETVRARFGVAPGMKLVGNIAALVGHKDQATLLRAAHAVAAQRRDVRFVILGDGELKQSLLALRRELNLAEIVSLPGFVDQAEQCLAAFDVFAMSSCMEGLGSIVLDAFAAGVPVAATAGGGLPELVREHITGLLVPVGDAVKLAEAILRLLEDKDFAARMISNAQTWVRTERSVESMTRDYLTLYQEVLSR